MLYCARCGLRYPVNIGVWRCICQGELEYDNPHEIVVPDLNDLTPRPCSIWRYREALPALEDEYIITFNEGYTPIITIKYHDIPIWLKLDFLCPTGSYKDRGTSVMISCLKQTGIKSVVEDSSGNAGASIAAYAGRAGMKCTVFVPSDTSPGKLIQIRAYGATIEMVDGTRQDVAKACQEAAEGNHNGETFYASHNWNPFFLEGIKTLAYEIWEQGVRNSIMPNWVVIPAGYGSCVLGAYRGFSDLVNQGKLHEIPRLIVVQAKNCAPVYEAYLRGGTEVLPIHGQRTIAEGIACSNPVRGSEILHAVRASGGVVMAVAEKEIECAAIELAKDGVFVEPTSAVVVAALKRLIDNEVISGNDIALGILTGTGLKATDYYGSRL